jgi:NAD+ kinase
VAHLEVCADGQLVNVYSADGLVFSTPTGSTAYNLSAGGPLIHPGAPVLAMTPICPHTLSNRSVIFTERTRLRIDVEKPHEDVHVTRDGRPCFDPARAFPIEIGIAPERFRLIQKPGYQHFQVIQTKLGWSGNHLSQVIGDR